MNVHKSPRQALAASTMRIRGWELLGGFLRCSMIRKGGTRRLDGTQMRQLDSNYSVN